jgi:hypothetical protein
MTQNRFIPLHSLVAGAVPTASGLYQGELALNLADGRIYTRSGSAILVLNETEGFFSSSQQIDVEDIPGIEDFARRTESNSFHGTQEITGSLVFNGASVEVSSSKKSGIFNATELIEPLIPATRYSGVSIEYTAQRTNAIRSGIILASWKGSEITHTDVSNTEIGDDINDLSFNFVRIGDDIRFRAYSQGLGSGEWTVQFLFKMFPNLM